MRALFVITFTRLKLHSLSILVFSALLLRLTPAEAQRNLDTTRFSTQTEAINFVENVKNLQDRKSVV